MPMTEHHVIPVSLYGSHIPENIIKLERIDHDILHKILNINSNVLRNLRYTLNDVLVFKPCHIDSIKNAQLQYFQNTNLLNNKVANQQAVALSRLVRRRASELASLGLSFKVEWHEYANMQPNELRDATLHRVEEYAKIRKESIR